MSRTLPLLSLAALLALSACQRAPEPSDPGRPEPAVPASPVTPQADGPAMGTRSPDAAADAVNNSYSGSVPNDGSANAPVGTASPPGDALPPPPPSPQ